MALHPAVPMAHLFPVFALCAISLLHRSVVAYRGDRREGMEVATRSHHLPRARRALAAFGCPTRPARHGEALRFPAAWLDIANPHHDPVVWGVAQAKLAALESEAENGLAIDPLRAFIIDYLTQTHRVPRLKQAAVHLGISSRTIVRSLARANASYHKLVEAERKARAMVLIADTTLPLAEVARQLGFSDVSSFGRSVRGWFGAAPGHLRKAPGLMAVRTA